LKTNIFYDIGMYVHVYLKNAYFVPTYDSGTVAANLEVVGLAPVANTMITKYIHTYMPTL
jgi:hypothetical protein